MSHETHDAAHHDNPNDVKKIKTSFSSSFWFVLILAGLFIAAVNFVNIMGHDDGHGAGADGHGTTHGTTNHNTSNSHSGTANEHEPAAGHQGGEIITDTSHNAGEHVTDTPGTGGQHTTEGH